MPITFLSRTSEQPQYSGALVQTSLTGNVGDWVKTTIDFESFIGFESSLFNSISISTGNLWSLPSGTWESLGFKAGQSLSGEYDYASNPTAGTNTTIDISTLGLTVISVNGSDMQVSGALFSPMGINYSIPSTTPNYFFNYINVYVEIGLVAVDFKYNQILNSQVSSPTLNSLLDGTTSSLRVSGLDASNLGTVSTLSPLIPLSGTTIKQCTIVGLGIVGSKNKFRLELIHQIEGSYDQASNLTNNNKPNWYSSSECVTDIYQVKMYSVAYDENSAIKSDLSDGKIQSTGNTGWFNENFNGGLSKYSLTDVEFFDDSATQITGLRNEGETTIRFNLNSSALFDSGSSEFNFGIGIAPLNRGDLGNKSVTAFGMRCGNSLGELISYPHTAAATAISESGFPNDVNAQIDASSVWFNVVSDSLVEVEIIVSVNADFTTYINSLGVNDQLFYMWASVGNSVDFSTSDRVNLSYSNQVFTPEVLPITFENVQLANYFPNELDYYNNPAINENEGYVFCPEDDYHFGFEILFPINNVINNASIGLELYDVTTGLSVYRVDSFNASLGNSLLNSDGTQEINFTSARQFNYLNTFKDSIVTIQRKTTLDTGSLRGYKFVIPFRIRWEWWIQNNAIPSVFYDILEPNNNINNLWETKLSANYGIRQFVDLNTTDELGNAVLYSNNYALSLKDYFDDKAYTYGIETYGDSTYSTDNLDLGATKTNKYTSDLTGILEDNATYVLAKIEESGQIFSNTYGEVCIEVEDGSGWLSIWKIRTDQIPESNNPLQPLSGQSALQVITTTGKVELRCQIDPSLLPSSGINFKLSASFSGSKTPEGGGSTLDYLERSLGWAKVVNDKAFNPEEREFKEDCCYKNPVLADEFSDDNFKNDIKGLYRDTQGFAQSWTLIRCSDETEYSLTDNTYGVYFPTGSYTYEPNLTIFQLHWKKVLTLLGQGDYVIKETTVLFGRTPVDSFSCPFELRQFSFENARNTVRIESVQNGYLEELGVNFKGINFLDHLRFEGKFGYQEHSYDQTFLVDTNNNQQLNRSDLTSEFILNSGLLPHKCVTKPLFDFYLRATSLYVSDYNNDNHSWDYVSYPVVLVNPEKEKYFSNSRSAVVSIKFKERVLKRRLSTCVGDRPLNFLSDAYVFNDQCPTIGAKDLYWELDFFDTDDIAFIPASAFNVGTLTTLLSSSNVGSITISTDGVLYGIFTLPFTPISGTDYYFKRSSTTVTGQYILQGTYV